MPYPLSSGALRNAWYEGACPHSTFVKAYTKWRFVWLLYTQADMDTKFRACGGTELEKTSFSPFSGKAEIESRNNFENI